MEINLDTWIISDTHFGHRNIIRYCNRPMNHDSLMVNNWKDAVAESDTILHLGDLMVWYNEVWMGEAIDRIRELPGKKFIIRGNHDEEFSDEFFNNLGFEVIEPFVWQSFELRVLFSHYVEWRDSDWHVNIHGHNHTNSRFHDGPKHINVSIEHMNYKPARLRDILKEKRH